MHVLFIGLDRGLFDEKSGDSVKRHKAYARALSRVTSIVFTRASEGFKRKSFGNFVVVPTNSVSRASFVHDAYRIASDIISKERIDVVSTQDPFVTGLIGVLLKRKYGIRLNVQVHTDITSAFWRSESMLNRVYSVLSRRVLKAADSVRVVNMKTFNFLRKSFPGKKVFFVPIATDVKFWRLRKDYKFRKRVIMVSRLSREKNLLMLVSAMKSVVASHPGTECVIVGEGPEKARLVGKIKSLGLEKNVRLVGKKSHAEIKKLFARSDVFVLPSNYEGWGLAAVEALASGVPVIMTDTGCAGSAVINNKTGIVIGVMDSNGLVNALNRLLASPGLTEKFGRAGQKLVFDKFNPKKLMKEWLECLRRT